MAKIITKRPIGKRVIAKIEVKASRDKNNVLSNSFKTVDGIIHHNCNGPHVPLVVVDEIDTVSGEGLKAFKDISGMLDSKGGKQSLRLGISTRKSRYGLMNKQIEDIEATPDKSRQIRRWTAFEFTERCDDNRSGTKEIPLYINQSTMELLTEENFKKKDPSKHKDYSMHIGYEGCATCPLFPICLTDAKKQTSKSPMLKPLKDIIAKVRSEGADWALSQLMNLKPSVEGIVFKEFNEGAHVKTWSEMWKILTGKDFPGECTHDIFVKKCFSEDTEVLTNEGFVPFPKLKNTQLIASLDDDGNLIYEAPTDYIKRYHSGNMVNIYNEIGGHGKQLDLLLTPDHQQTYVRRSDLKRGKIKIHKKPLSELPDGDYVIPAAPLSDNYNQQGFASPISFMTDDQFYAFLGLWLAEGSISSAKEHAVYRKNEVSVSQYKTGYWQKVEKLMNSIAWPTKLRKKIDKRQPEGYSWHVLCKELYAYLSPYRYAKNKAIHRDILTKANKKQLSILLEWAILGDGASYSHNDKQQSYYSTCSPQLANDIQEIAFKLGYRTNLSHKYCRPAFSPTGTKLEPMYRVHIHNKKRNNSLRKGWYIKSSTHKSEYGKTNRNINNIKNYEGNVYCVTMPSGRLFVRRNGVIALSGNCHEMNLTCVGGVDWGWSSPNTVVYFYIDARENVYVVRCDGMTYVSQPSWIHHFKTKYHHQYKCQVYTPDVADQGAVQEMQKAGLPVASNISKGSINTGIQVIKKWLKSPGTMEPKIFFAQETCSSIIAEMGMYHYKKDASGACTDDPDTEYDHWIDALRYGMTLMFGRSTILLGEGLSDASADIQDARGHFIRTPTPQEFMQSQGVNVSSEQDLSKLGKIGTAKELEESQDPDDGVSGGGNFLWSF